MIDIGGEETYDDVIDGREEDGGGEGVVGEYVSYDAGLGCYGHVGP